MARSALAVITAAELQAALGTTRVPVVEQPTSVLQKNSRVESLSLAAAVVAVDLPAVPAVQVDWLVVTALMVRA